MDAGLTPLSEFLIDLAELIERTGNTRIVVTGPQRSGTTIAAHIIAQELGYRYIDEIEYGASHPDVAAQHMEGGHCVLQGPAIFYTAETLGAIVVVMRRDRAEIHASEQRIRWGWEWWERAKYDAGADVDMVDYRYSHWDAQQRDKCYSLDLEYNALSAHPLFKPKAEREHFTDRQWK